MTTLAAPLITASDDEDRLVRALLVKSIRRCGHSREQIASEMTQILAPRQVTVNQLNQWTAVSHGGWRIPAAYVRAFCEATGDDTLQRFLLGAQLSAVLSLGERVAHALPSLLDNARDHAPTLVFHDEERTSLQR